MKAGDSWQCPQCGKNSFLKQEPVYNGWVKTGDVLKCAACGSIVKEPSSEAEPSGQTSDSAKKLDALSQLFGGVKTESAKPFFQNEKKRFCRDCRHRVMNAFRIYCPKHNKDVNPMDDCPDFEERGPAAVQNNGISR